ncbi:MAG: hypothetical protein O3B21_15115 [Proteobacteria bacterium]|nr:hypothetical protein [Pseudomonadota bacterium]MDA1357883.1 hypothetical protein [Pseudomonadota bacterium]
MRSPHNDLGFLTADAVLCAKNGQITPCGYYNIEGMVKRIRSAKGHMLSCST